MKETRKQIFLVLDIFGDFQGYWELQRCLVKSSEEHLFLQRTSSLVPSIQTVVHNSSSKGSDEVFQPPWVLGTHMAHRYTCRQHTHEIRQI